MESNEPPKFILLEKTFDYLKSSDAANPILSGYFKKLMLALFKHKPMDIYNYIYSHPEIIKNLCHNIHSKSLSEVLSKTLQISDSYMDDMSHLDHRNMRREAIISLITIAVTPIDPSRTDLDEDDDYNAKLNACDVLEEVFQNQVSCFEDCASEVAILDRVKESIMKNEDKLAH